MNLQGDIYKITLHRLFANCVSLNKSCQVSHEMKYSEESSNRKMAKLNYKKSLTSQTLLLRFINYCCSHWGRLMLAPQPPSFFQRSSHHVPKIPLLTVLSFLSTSCHLQLQESLKAMQGVCVFSSPRGDSFVCGLQVGSEWHQAAAGVKAMALGW